MATHFLATVLGWYLVIVSLLLLIRQEVAVTAMKELIGQRGLLFVVGILTVIIGLLMVISHNLWVMDWPVLVTLFAWLILIGGLIRLFFPETVYRIWRQTIDKPKIMNVCGVITFLIGLFLLYEVYFAG